MKKLNLLFGKLCLIALMALPMFTSCNNDEDEEYEAPGAYQYGTFVLNEGSSSTEEPYSTLIYISPDNNLTDSVYYKENGSYLGLNSQDLYIANNKIYIISQIGNGDGMLVVANAGTLKKEDAYSKDNLSELVNPSHIAVVGNNAYIRDNRGIYLLNLTSKELAFMDGTEGALKNRMVVIGEKVFAGTSNSVVVLQGNKIMKAIDFENAPTGMVRSADGNIFVSTNGSPAKITKISSADYSIIKENELNDYNLSNNWGATPAITAKENMIYFRDSDMNIYCHDFIKNKTEKLAKVSDFVDNSGTGYNNLAVNPVNGNIYVTTIKGFGADAYKNNISIFCFEEENTKLVKNFENYTLFPAGVFFTYDFE